jgi:DNA polymerase-3 subunit delta
MVVTTSLVFGFFIQLLKYHGLKDKTENVAVVIGVNPYFLKNMMALKKLPYEKVSQIVALCGISM